MTSSFDPWPRRLLAVARRLARRVEDSGGNVALIYAMTLPILVTIVGFALDFGRAAQLRSALNAVADAAVLAALSPNMMGQSNATAQAAATSMFNAQAAVVVNSTQNLPAITVTVTNPGNNALSRSVTVCYSASTPAMMSSLIGMSTMAVANCATGAAQVPPNIDFYVLLDNSPSMALPSTQSGINLMQTLTANEGGCAFACHQASTNNGDTAGNPCADGSMPTQSGGLYCATSTGGQIDNFQLARNNSITLRLDELSLGLSTLLQTATTTASSSAYSSPPAYRFSISTMNSQWAIGFTNLMSLTSNYTSAWSSASSKFGVVEMYDNNNVCANSSCSSGGGVGDVQTNFDNALNGINQLMPTPGKGTNQSGDSPQEIMFFVTDGVEDEILNGNRLIQTLNGGSSTNYCTTIKNRGIKIAILYTEYLPVYNNGFYMSYVYPFQSEIGTALQACASPGLFIDAATGTDLSAALSQLFQSAVATANLTN